MHILWGGGNNPDLNRALGDWCAAQIGLPRGFRDHSSMGVFDGDALIGVMVFHDWHPERGAIEISGAATTPRWLTRPILKEMFGFPFHQLGCQMVVMRVSDRNVMWNGRGLPRLLKAYGFNAYPIPRLRGRDEVEIIYTLTDDAWKSNGFNRHLAKISEP